NSFFVSRGAIPARCLAPRYISRLSVFPCQCPFLESVGSSSAFYSLAIASNGSSRKIKTSVTLAFFPAKEPWQVSRTMHNPYDFDNFLISHSAVKHEILFKLLEGVEAQSL